jgi:hypothetical protein
MWDHMAMIRSARIKKVIPPLAKPLPVAQTLLKLFPNVKKKEEIARLSRERRSQLSKDIIRIVKYGTEMPDWVEYPEVIFNRSAKDKEDVLNYHIPGGMTIKPDKDANSHFIPWYYVIVADVGAMYPTILKALNFGADVVRLARRDEIPDYWVWLKKLPKEFLESRKDSVKWWWQNGDEHMALNFGIKYNTKSTFQPDFLVLFNDGKLGIFDTKASGYNEDDNKLKSEALQQYIKGENRKGKNIFGGLVIKEGQHFRINMKKSYSAFKEKEGDWEYMDKFIN